MKLFIAVIFFCSGDQCAFWKSQDNFFNIEECTVEVAKAMQFFESQSAPAFGACLPINTKNNI